MLKNDEREIYQIISDYLSKKISDEDLNRLRLWMEESEENRGLFVTVSAIVNASKCLSDGEMEQHRDMMLDRLNARIDADEMNPYGNGRLTGVGIRKRQVWKWIVSSASAAAAIVLFCLVPLLRTESVPEPDFAEYRNNTEDVIAVRLQDSSKVWLSRGGAIKYRHYNLESDERTVILQGKAFFAVQTDSLHPFVVKTDNLAVKVLGTEFAVECAEDNTSVFLERGSVRLQTLDGVGLVRLTPDQVAVYNSVSQDLEVSSMMVSSHIVNNYNKVVLNNASIYDIISHVKSMYGTEIMVVNAVDTVKRYNLSYRRSNSLEEIVDIVETLTGAECIIP